MTMAANAMASTPTSAAAGTSSGVANGGGQASSVVFEELSFDEIKVLHVVGQGTYGIVKKAIWREKVVAVKIIEGDQARKAFLVEVLQLSRVKHKNIVTLYGACTKNPVCLVMEYAEGGSLHRVLHCYPKPVYKAAHAISWMLQCAEGVHYLHSLTPRALVHRDLKPLNLLLIDNGRKLKICDFGTACDLKTHMTNSKGSAQWMAPEVFEGSKYSEKCDVFSWGIMLWEVLTRRKPFAESGGTAYSIMWAVHSGTRPPLIQNCPKPIEILMTQCWDKSPEVRPPMSEVASRISTLMKFFKGADEPLIYYVDDYDQQQTEEMDDDEDAFVESDITVANPLGDTDRTTAVTESEPVFTLPALPARILREERNAGTQQSSAPASLAGSDEDVAASLRLVQIKGDEIGKGSGYAKGHRRTSSYDTAGASTISKPLAAKAVSAIDNCEQANVSSAANAKTRDELRLELPNVCAPLEHSASGGADSFSTTSLPVDEATAGVPLVYLALDNQYQPLRPFPGSRESAATFLEHCQLAEEYIKIQEEITLLLKRKQDLITELNNNIKEAHQTSRYQEYQQLLQEKEQMQKLQQTLKTDLDAARKQRKP